MILDHFGESYEVSHRSVSPHKFGGDPMAEYLWLLTLDGMADETTGDALDWFYIVHRFGKRLLICDTQGFVSVDRHDDEQSAIEAFESIQADYLATLLRGGAVTTYESEEYLSEAEQAAEIRAERMMDWVMSGGDPADASTFAFYEEHGWPESPATGETCEHGLDAGLCAGPGHYPMDM